MIYWIVLSISIKKASLNTNFSICLVKIRNHFFFFEWISIDKNACRKTIHNQEVWLKICFSGKRKYFTIRRDKIKNSITFPYNNDYENLRIVMANGKFNASRILYEIVFGRQIVWTSLLNFFLMTELND